MYDATVSRTYHVNEPSKGAITIPRACGPFGVPRLLVAGGPLAQVGALVMIPVALV